MTKLPVWAHYAIGVVFGIGLGMMLAVRIAGHYTLPHFHDLEQQLADARARADVCTAEHEQTTIVYAADESHLAAIPLFHGTVRLQIMPGSNPIPLIPRWAVPVKTVPHSLGGVVPVIYAYQDSAGHFDGPYVSGSEDPHLQVRPW